MTVLAYLINLLTDSRTYFVPVNILTNYVYHINYYQRALSSYHYLIIVATMHLCVCNRVAEFILIKSEYLSACQSRPNET